MDLSFSWQVVLRDIFKGQTGDVWAKGVALEIEVENSAKDEEGKPLPVKVSVCTYSLRLSIIHTYDVLLIVVGSDRPQSPIRFSSTVSDHRISVRFCYQQLRNTEPEHLTQVNNTAKSIFKMKLRSNWRQQE